MIRDRQIVLAERVTSGGCRNYEDYKEICGMIKAFRLCEDDVKATANSLFQTEVLAPKGVDYVNEEETPQLY